MATALVDNWTEMKCIQLIREFRARPILWDQKDPFFFNKSMKPKLWKEIGEKLEIPALECKHKMNILMSSFRREKAKIMHKIEDNNGDTSNMWMSTWFAFKEMMFLMDKDSERKRQQMGTDSVDDDIEDCNQSTSRLKRTLLKHHIQPPISSSKRPRFSGLLQEVTKKPLNTAAATTAAATTAAPTTATTSAAPPQPQTVATASDTDDEIKSFVNFISFKMKKYSETTKNMVQRAICDIIFKADQNFYENSDKFVIVDDEKDPFAKNIDDETMSNEIKGEYDTECYIEED